MYDDSNPLISATVQTLRAPSDNVRDKINYAVFSSAMIIFTTGLHLTLFIEQPEYVGILSPESGVRITVHSPHVQPSPQVDGITAATGMATSIGIRQASRKIDVETST